MRRPVRRTRQFRRLVSVHRDGMGSTLKRSQSACAERSVTSRSAATERCVEPQNEVQAQLLHLDPAVRELRKEQEAVPGTIDAVSREDGGRRRADRTCRRGPRERENVRVSIVGFTASNCFTAVWMSEQKRCRSDQAGSPLASGLPHAAPQWLLHFDTPSHPCPPAPSAFARRQD
jgi:hypothetical protein